MYDCFVVTLFLMKSLISNEAVFDTKPFQQVSFQTQYQDPGYGSDSKGYTAAADEVFIEAVGQIRKALQGCFPRRALSGIFTGGD